MRPFRVYCYRTENVDNVPIVWRDSLSARSSCQEGVAEASTKSMSGLNIDPLGELVPRAGPGRGAVLRGGEVGATPRQQVDNVPMRAGGGRL
jgi:hypothetical protein